MANRMRNVKDRKTEIKKSYYVYVLLCVDGSYYTGYTNDVVSRFQKHRKGLGARYTRIRKPERIVYVEEFSTRAAAVRREREIKLLSHRQKNRLVSNSPVELSRKMNHSDK